MLKTKNSPDSSNLFSEIDMLGPYVSRLHLQARSVNGLTRWNDVF